MVEVKELKQLIGKKITAIRPITQRELDSEGWDGHGATCVIELEGGIKIYPSEDDEGNGAGTLFGEDSTGHKFYVYTKDTLKEEN